MFEIYIIGACGSEWLTKITYKDWKSLLKRCTLPQNFDKQLRNVN